MLIKTGIRSGALLGILLVVATQILTWLGLGTSNWYVVMTYLAVIAMTLFCVKNLRSILKGNFTFLKSVLSVLIMIIISRYIFQAYMYIYIHYIDPTWVETVSETWTAMLQEKNFDDEQIEKRIATFQNAYKILNMFTIEIIFVGLSQFILGCIVAGIYKWRTK